MMAIAAATRASRRRWVISAVIVALVHGGIAAAVVTWRKTMAPAEPPGPIVVELAPTPAAPAAPPTGLTPATEQAKASPDKPMEKIEKKTEERSAAKGEEKPPSKPVEELPIPAPMTPSQSVEEHRGDTRAVSGGGAAGTAQPNRSSAQPIDTRIGEPLHPRFKRTIKVSDWQKLLKGGSPSDTVGPWKNFAGHQQPPAPGPARGMAGNAGGMTRNALGMLVQDPALAHGISADRGAPQLDTAAGVARNAVGAPAVAAMNPVGPPAGAARNAVGALATSAVSGTNAVGATAVNHPSATNISQHGIGPIASASSTMPQAVINGTRMIRPGTSTGVIGGPARIGAGVINGTTIRPR